MGYYQDFFLWNPKSSGVLKIQEISHGNFALSGWEYKNILLPFEKHNGTGVRFHDLGEIRN